MCAIGVALSLLPGALFILGGGSTAWQLGIMPGIDVEMPGCDGEVLCEDCLED